MEKENIIQTCIENQDINLYKNSDINQEMNKILYDNIYGTSESLRHKKKLTKYLLKGKYIQFIDFAMLWMLSIDNDYQVSRMYDTFTGHYFTPKFIMNYAKRNKKYNVLKMMKKKILKYNNI
jgi:hypothetical protein